MEASVDPALEAVRVSMTLRGLRPSSLEMQEVRDNPEALARLAAEWVQEPAFGEAIMGMHAELLHLRVETEPILPSIGPLDGVPRRQVAHSLSAAPLQLIRRVMEQDRPYTDLFQTSEVMVDAITADVWGLDYASDGPEWQVTQWKDGRPAAGLLVDSNLWMRHTSSDTNHNRGRANLLHRAWLCDDLSRRTVEVLGLDLADEDAVTDAVNNDPNCMGCHEVLDPLSANFAAFRRYIIRGEVSDAYDAGCVDGDLCYPLRLFRPEQVDSWQALSLPPPALNGQEVADLAGLGAQLGSDKRLAPCVARQFAAYLGQQPGTSVAQDEVERLAQVLVESNWNMRKLALEIVLAPRFSVMEGDVGPLFARPEQHARSLEAITGFRWLANPSGDDCTDCWGDVDLLRDAMYGYRAVAGGIDGYDTLVAENSPQPMRSLVRARYAEEAAAFRVGQDWLLPPSQRRWLDLVDVSQPQNTPVRAQIEQLHYELFGAVVAPADLDVTDTVWLYEQLRVDGASPKDAWTGIMAALLQSPELVVF
ncbi:MAG: DUF1588 domain-containing protein [Rhodobacterales bacterium]|nr:DUF1588 domain-containing protein [Rhodobacterales bacterium]